MKSEQNVGGRDRLARAVLAAAFSVLALRWLKAGKRGRGLLAGVGALGFGFNATTGYCGVNDALDVDTTAGTSSDVDIDVGGRSDSATSVADESTSDAEPAGDGLTCAFCGETIEPGQRRGPNDQGQIVHDDCA